MRRCSVLNYSQHSKNQVELTLNPWVCGSAMDGTESAMFDSNQVWDSTRQAGRGLRVLSRCAAARHTTRPSSGAVLISVGLRAARATRAGLVRPAREARHAGHFLPTGLRPAHGPVLPPEGICLGCPVVARGHKAPALLLWLWAALALPPPLLRRPCYNKTRM